MGAFHDNLEHFCRSDTRLSAFMSSMDADGVYGNRVAA
jgi:hypothetical protein